MNKLFVCSKNLKETFDRRYYDWYLDKRCLVIVKRDGTEKIYIPLEAIGYFRIYQKEEPKQ